MNSRIFEVSVLSCPLSNPEPDIWAHVWRKRADGSMTTKVYDISTAHRMQRITDAVQNTSPPMRFSAANTGEGDIGWRAYRVVIDGEVVG